MKHSSAMIALCGLMGALAVVIMLLASFIAIGTYAGPVLAGIAFIPVVCDYGGGIAAALYAVVSAICLILIPDKESAVIFLFLGWYPAARAGFNRIKPKLLRLMAKLISFNAAVFAAYWLMLNVFGMAELAGEYQSYSAGFFLLLVILGNVTFVVYDLALSKLTPAYILKIRPRLKKGG